MPLPLKKIHLLWILVTLLSTACWARPPKVIRLYPENGATDIPPGPIKIRILFDQDMNTRGYSICGGGENYPETIGRPRWSGKRSFVMNAKLKPNHSYTFSINSSSYKNFKNISGEPAQVLQVTFHTSGNGQTESEEPALTVQENQKALDLLRSHVTLDYSYRNRKGINWDALFDQYEDRLLKADSPEKFVSVARLILSQAEDKHIWFKIDDQTIPSFIRPVTPNANFSKLPTLVPKFKKHNDLICSGQFEDGIGYILIDSWVAPDATVLSDFYAVLNDFADADGLIIDVRGNGGGNENLARLVAGCFIDEPKVYAKNINVDDFNPGLFLPVRQRQFQPNRSAPAYRGKVAVLIGPVVMSSCEAFVLMMKQVPGCRLVGAPTQGCSGNPQPYDLENGVTVFLPSWQAMLPNGTCFEGIGIQPDIRVNAIPTEITTSDPVIEAARKALK